METIFETNRGRIVQSDQLHCYFLHFNDISFKLAPCALIALKAKIHSFDLPSLLLGDEDFGIEVLPICNRDRFLILDLEELIALKELIDGAFVMLELNSIVAYSTC